MAGLIEALAALVAGVSGAAAVVGGWAWWQVREACAFWIVLRTSQVLAVLLAATAGVAAALGKRPDDGLFWVYALVPIAVSFVAEQFRVISAQTVLDARGLADAAAVGALPEDEQRSVVVAILRRETGVMALAALVVCLLAIRAIGTASGL